MTEREYREIKARHAGVVMLFTVGDFYQLFDEDAQTGAKLLGLTLTTHNKTMTMTEFPHHKLESYLKKLLQAGHRVAICKQVDK